MPTLKRIANRFAIHDLQHDLIGHGMMGDVYRGTDLQTGQVVAIKALNPQIVASQPEMIARFLREGETLRQLNHPNIIKMIGAVEEEKRYYLIMEYIPDGSLHDLLAQQTLLPQERVLKIGLELADALARTHYLNIIHRDLKPANVLLKSDGTPLLSDFGVALLTTQTRLTQDNAVVGTPVYLSPEAWSGMPLDARADLWSLGVMLYEMLAGALPFQGESFFEVMQAIIKQDVPDLRQYRPDVQPALANLISRLLIKDREKRIPTARALGAELEAIQQGRPAPASQPQSVAPLLTPLVSVSQTQPTIEAELPPRPRDTEQVTPELEEQALLRQLLVNYFTLEEIKTLCSDLGINYEELPGDTLSNKARELIIYCRNRNLLNRLVQYCQKQRPHLSWPDFDELSVVSDSSIDARSPEWLPFHYEKPGIRARPRRFFGRHELIVQIRQLLDAHEKVLLYGLGGIGKTALAATLADQHIQEGKGSVIWTQPGQDDITSIFDAFLKAFATAEEKRKIGPLTGEVEIEAMSELIGRTGATLLVVDDFSGDGSTLHTLLQALPLPMAVLVTSRRIFPFGDRTVQVGELSPQGALELLADHAGNTDLLTDESALALCQLLGFHPYAVKIAGATLNVDSITPQELQERIASAPYNLAMPEGFDERHRRGMKPILDESFRALSDKGKNLFRAFGAFFTPTTTEELLITYLQGDSQLVKENLSELTRRSLVERRNKLPRFATGKKAIPYYTMHDLAYYYARRLHNDLAGRDRMALTAIKQYVTDHAQDLNALFYEQRNILGALEQAQTDDPETMMAVMRVLVMHGYFDRFGSTLKFQQLMSTAGQMLQTYDDGQGLRHFLLGKLGNAYHDQGDLGRAFATYQEALQLAPNINRKAILLAVMARVRNAQGFSQEADDYFATAMQRAEESKSVAVSSFVFQQQAIVAGVRQNYELARQYAQKGMELLGSVGDRIGEGYLKIILGSIELDMGKDAHKALAYHREVYAIAQAENDLVLTAYALYALGQDYHGLQMADEMGQALHEARDIFRQIGHTTADNEVVAFMKKISYIEPASNNLH